MRGASEAVVPFAAGDRVVVSWMGDRVQATVWRVIEHTRGGRLLADPHYRLSIAGVRGHPIYLHSETEVFDG